MPGLPVEEEGGVLETIGAFAKDAAKSAPGQQMAVGGVTGWCAGYAFIKLGKVVSFAIGTGVIIVTGIRSVLAMSLPWVLAGGAAAALLSAALRCRLRRPWSLSGSVVVLTGASSGLGAAIARLARARGARLVLLARSLETLEASAAELGGPAHCVYRYADLADPETDFGGLLRESLAELGAESVDLLVNCGGLSMRGSCEETDLSVHRQLMEVNYFGQVSLTQQCLRFLRPGSRIVVVSSVQGLIAVPHRSAYAASKHALNAYFDCLRAELAERSIGVCVASPGYIATELSRNALTGTGGRYGRLDATTASGMSAGEAAEAILSAAMEGRHEATIADLKSRIAILLRFILPSLYHRIMAKRALASDKAFQIAHHKGIIKLNKSRWEKEVDRVKKGLGDVRKELDPNYQSPVDKVAQFCKDNVYLAGGAVGGFFLGIASA